METIKKTALTLLEAIVNKEDIKNVSVSDEGENIKVAIEVAPLTIGKIIGKEGKVIKALRTLLRIVSYKELGKRLVIDVVKPIQS